MHSTGFELPRDLREKLAAFRGRLRRVKVAEGVLAGIVGLAVSYLAVFALDRFVDTPAWLRLTLLIAGALGFAVFLPHLVRRWVFGSRRLVDVARILRTNHPHTGDRLLGIVELTEAHDTGQASPALCRAAIAQVAEETRSQDWTGAVPRPRHRQWAWVAGFCGVLALAALLVPGAGSNALVRWAAPWLDTPRFTFAQLETLPESLVVPYGESFALTARLRDESRWRPDAAATAYGPQAAFETRLVGDEYVIRVPAQTEPGRLVVRVGDTSVSTEVTPTQRPELTELFTSATLPEYLARPVQRKDGRGGSVTVLRGSHVQLEAEVSRELGSAHVDGRPAEVEGSTMRSASLLVSVDSTHELVWEDVHGLSPRAPFAISLRVVEDEPPLVSCRGLADQQVVLDSAVLAFDVSVEDDFGVRALGVEWSGVPDPQGETDPERGEYEIARGGPERTDVHARATFSAAALGIRPQPIHLRVWAEDYRPDGERAWSATYRVFVLDPAQHMIWTTEQLKRWERRVLEVRDEEERLLARNEELAALKPEELSEPGAQSELRKQVSAERANGRRLGELTTAGKQLIADAARNEQFNAATLEKWAEALESLERLARERMPSVATMLAEASAPSPSSPSKPPSAPTVTDRVAAARRDASPAEEPKESPSQPSNASGRLGLPSTELPGPPPPSPEEQPEDPAMAQLNDAVGAQRQLLADFNAVMDDIAEILQNLQDSTFVKRLKRAAREEMDFATVLRGRLQSTFGKLPGATELLDRALFKRLHERQEETATRVLYIADDLKAYFERNQKAKFDTVQREMREADIVGNLKLMATAVSKSRQGATIADAEFWVDELDRWAEILVGPG